MNLFDEVILIVYLNHPPYFQPTRLSLAHQNLVIQDFILFNLEFIHYYQPKWFLVIPQF